MRHIVLVFSLLTSLSAIACAEGGFDGDLAIIREHLDKQLDCPHANMRVPGRLALDTARCPGTRPEVTLTAAGQTYNVLNVEEDFVRGSGPHRHKLKLTFTIAERKHPLTCLAPLTN